MDHLQLLNDKIDVQQIYSLVNDASCGACSLFVGTTRDSFEGKKVISLEYEAYENMALKEMRIICTDLRVRWPYLKHIAIFHRLGVVSIGEESVVIAASAPHRADALDSVAFAIDQLKARVPIWKKEVYESASSEWKANKECLWSKGTKSNPKSFDFLSCKIDQAVENVPGKFVQVRVNDGELDRRVNCFLKRKRYEINLHNIIDFKQHVKCANIPDTMNDSCARTQSILFKQEQSRGHLKVRRTFNEQGPQTKPNYSFELNKLMVLHKNTKSASKDSLNLIGNARLRDIEHFLNVHTNECNSIFNRIKHMEDKILFLESICPEYKYYIQAEIDLEKPLIKRPKRKVHSAVALDSIISKINKEI
ncbi:molybdopterin synthase catalytic subunit [Drosophila busckii]|uniref:molybdopterin synthase catalytic subunit n=1 Tax=Drosophila busckii TaxID=30019 RepID=UPI00083EB693|nr:molybdopterin synthase catalytic subunit [Drosophila busckii]